MEELAAKQVVIGKEIEKITNKFRNDAPERKTVNYLEEKLQQLQKLWDEFETNDNNIRERHSDSINHLYFQKDYYKMVETGCHTIVNELKNLLKHHKIERAKGSQDNIGNVKSMTSKTSKSDSTNTTTNQNQPVDDTDITDTKQMRKQFFLINALENILNTTSTIPGQLKSYYDFKLATINKYWSQIEIQHQLICEQLINTQQYQYDEQIYFDLENKVQTVIIELLKCIELIQQSNQSISVTAETSNNSSTTQALMKLPKIVLPKFNGNYLNWQQFHDLYNQMVHSQPLSNAQKMWYLKSNLAGEAEKLIKHLSVSEDNYNTAWDILNQRYNNRRLIVTSLIDKLLTQPTIVNESASALRNMHDNTKECLLSLENLGLKVMEYWDPLIIHILTKKLDRNTHSLYEQTLKIPKELQSLKEFLNFLENRFQSLEALGNKNNNKNLERTKSTALVSIKFGNCLLCKEKHAIYQCNEFLKLTPSERQRKALQLDLCLNCLKQGHAASKCNSRSCLKCNKRHNTLLRFYTKGEISNRSNNVQAGNDTSSPKSAAALTATNEQIISSYVFLGTALATIKNREGDEIKCRILLDSGSQLNFITDKLRRKLRMFTIETPINISGIGKSQIRINNRVNITISSMNTNYSTQLEAYVIKEIASYQPQRHIQIDQWNIPSNIRLADPEFNMPQEVDILLGAEVYGELMRSGQIKLDKQLPILQNTVLGWIVLGKASIEENRDTFCGITNLDLEKTLQKFWDLEEYSEKSTLTLAEQKCEEFFEATATRDESGRFTVNLRILGNPDLLKNSEAIAYRRLLSIERKLSKDKELKQQYTDFLDEYLKLGHMKEIKREQIGDPHYSMLLQKPAQIYH